MKIYFIATQYKNKTLDINWTPLTYDEANKRLDELAGRNKELASRNQANNINYKIVSIEQSSSADAEGKISRD